MKDYPRNILDGVEESGYSRRRRELRTKLNVLAFFCLAVLATVAMICLLIKEGVL
jgi:hypothetical protein